MLFFWRWDQIYAGTSTVECDQVCNALSEAGVQYVRRAKTGHVVFPAGGGDTGARLMASAMMEPPESAVMYSVLVRKKDAGRAKYLMYRR